jgi:hypothetical protein
LTVSLLSIGSRRVANAQAISTFYTGRGAGVVTQDLSTGNILYSVYTAKGYNIITNITVAHAPKVGTAIAATGWNQTFGTKLWVSGQLTQTSHLEYFKP